MFHKEMEGQAVPRSCEGETQKFTDNCFSNFRFLLMLELHATVDLKCRWACFLGNGSSILPQSLIAAKHLKETSKLHHTGWGKTFVLLWTKSQAR